MYRLDFKEKEKFPVFQCVQLGAGGNGSNFFRSLLQDVYTYYQSHYVKYKNSFYSIREKPFGFEMVLADGDKVENKNLLNQLYTHEDVGGYKVEALVSRYGEHYNLLIRYFTEYVKDLETLQKLFPDLSKKYTSNAYFIPIIIGMLDNNKSRQLVHDLFYSDAFETLIWLDAGIEGQKISGTEEEIQNSGWGGQVVVGVKYKGKVILEPVTMVYQNIYEDAQSSFPGESCGELIVNHPQRSATNKFAAQIANNIMNTLFYTQEIHLHQVTFDAQVSYSRPHYISKEQYERFKTLKGE